MKIREIMTTNPKFAGEDDTVVKAAQTMRDVDVGAMPVKNTDGRITGIVTDRDMAVRIIAEGKNPGEVKIAQIMSTNPFTCNVEDSVESAARAMEKNQVRRLVVMDGDNPVGVVSLGDVAVKTPGKELSGKTVEGVSQPKT